MSADISDDDKARRGLQGPSWRWQYAVDLSHSRDSLVEDSIDEHVRDTVRFIRMLSGAPHTSARASSTYPIIAQAKTLWDTDHSRQQFVIMALSDFTLDEMSARLGVESEVIEIAERLFFDVRDSREAKAWINGHVILPETKAGHFELAVKYRQAFWGGPKVAEWILETGKGILGDSVQQIAEQEQLLQMKCLAALEMPLTSSKETLQFLKISLDHQHRLKRLEFEKEKFRTRAEQEIRRCELAERRQRIAEKQFEQRISVSRRKQERKHMKQERERLAAIQESIHQQRQYSERLKRIDLANQSPLASLTWKKSTTISTVLHTTNAPQDEQTTAAA